MPRLASPRSFLPSIPRLTFLSRSTLMHPRVSTHTSNMYMRNLQACGKGICTSGLPAAIEIMQSSAMRHRRIRGVRSRVSGGRRTKRKNSGEEKGENERRRKRVTAGGGERKRERGNEERKGKKINGWRKSVSCELRVASCRASRLS